MIKIDGVHLVNDLGYKILDGTDDELLPNTQSYLVDIPGRHGSYVFKSFFQPRQFYVNVLIPQQATRGDVQVMARKLSRMFLDQLGNPKDVELIYDFEPDKHYVAKLTGAIDIERPLRYGMFEFMLTAYDPFAYSNSYSDEITWGSEDITFEYQYLLGREGLGGKIRVTSPALIKVPVDGYAVRPVIEIEGSAEKLSISSNGRAIALPPFVSSRWLIDCEKYTVLKNGVNSFSDVDLGDFILNTGDNSISIDGLGIDVNLRIKFRDKYM